MAHQSAHDHYYKFLGDYFNKNGLQVLDVGGEGGRFEEITNEFGHDYTALNTGSVDFGVVLKPGEEYAWPIKKNLYDIVMSSSTFEHIPMFWLTFKEMVRVCKKGGYIYVCAPSIGPEHYIWDGWRFYQDSMKALARWGGVELEHSSTDARTEWCDTVGIFKKH